MGNLDMDTKDLVFAIVVALIFGMMFGASLVGMYYAESPHKRLVIPTEVADDICFQLTGNETAVAMVEEKKFICELPSFDATQNIIIRSNSD